MKLLQLVLLIVSLVNGSDLVMYKRNQSKCKEVYKSRGTRDCRWHAGLWRYPDREILRGEIVAYKIKWSNARWSGWYVPGVNDADSKFNVRSKYCRNYPVHSKTLRRMWSYFYDHTHKYIICYDYTSSTKPLPEKPYVEPVKPHKKWWRNPWWSHIKKALMEKSLASLSLQLGVRPFNNFWTTL